MENNEMKLITALCNALGFEVEKVCVNQQIIDDEIEQLKKSLSDLKWWQFIPPPLVFSWNRTPIIYEYKLIKKDGS